MQIFLFSSNCFGSLKYGYKFLSSLIISDISVTTVKPLYSRHHQDFKAVSLYISVRYIEVLSKLAYFTSQTCSRVLRYSTIEPKVSKGVGRRKSPETMY